MKTARGSCAIDIVMDASATARGIELSSCDGAIEITGNKVDLITGYYAYSLQSCDATPGARGLMANNMGSVGGNGSAYPFVIQNCDFQDIVFNSGHTYSTTGSGIH